MEWTKTKAFLKGFLIYCHSSVSICIFDNFHLHRKVHFEKLSKRLLAINLLWAHALKILSNTLKNCMWERWAHNKWMNLFSRYQVQFAKNFHVLYRKFTAQRFPQLFRYSYTIFILPLRLKKKPTLFWKSTTICRFCPLLKSSQEKGLKWKIILTLFCTLGKQSHHYTLTQHYELY